MPRAGCRVRDKVARTCYRCCGTSELALFTAGTFFSGHVSGRRERLRYGSPRDRRGVSRDAGFTRSLAGSVLSERSRRLIG